MEGATHFIEVYRHPDVPELYNSRIQRIQYKASRLETTSYSTCKTIAVWYIKPNTKYLKTSNQ